MKIITTLALTAIIGLGIGRTMAQAPIVASKVKLKTFNDVTWISDKKPEGDKITIIDFYNENNPSCVNILQSTVLPLAKKDTTLQIIVLALENSAHLENLAQGHPRIIVGIDTEKKVYDKFDVKYVPFSIVIGKDSKIVWLGMIDQFYNKINN